MRDASPALGTRYWTTICLASVAGCNLGDFVATDLHLGHWHGLAPLALIAVLLDLGRRRARRVGEGWYWAMIIVLRTAATNLADLMTHDLRIGVPWVIAALEGLLVLAALPVVIRLRASPRVDAWYWGAMLTAGTLGTVIGDCTAERFGLGTGLGTVVLGLVLAVVLAAGRPWRWSIAAGYWFAIVAVRAAGTTAGDFLAFRHGLALGLPSATVCSCAAFVATPLLWRATPDPQHSRQ